MSQAGGVPARLGMTLARNFGNDSDRLRLLRLLGSPTGYKQALAPGLPLQQLRRMLRVTSTQAASCSAWVPLMIFFLTYQHSLFLYINLGLRVED